MAWPAVRPGRAGRPRRARARTPHSTDTASRCRATCGASPSRQAQRRRPSLPITVRLPSRPVFHGAACRRDLGATTQLQRAASAPAPPVPGPPPRRLGQKHSSTSAPCLAGDPTCSAHATATEHENKGRTSTCCARRALEPVAGAGALDSDAGRQLAAAALGGTRNSEGLLFPANADASRRRLAREL